ncbi:MAG: 2'-5' RNA ligase family protein [Aurantibacter sp.]
MSEIKIYNLRIVPPNPVFNEVVHFKRQFINTFGKQPLAKSKPHITLAVFEMDIQYQDILIKVFDQLSCIEKFKLDIQGFDIFENNANVLLLKVPKTDEIEYIHRQVKILMRRDFHRSQKSFEISNTPHMTISKTDGKKMLYESLAFFQKIGYSKEIAINHLTLVSRLKGKTWDWEHHIELA